MLEDVIERLTKQLKLANATLRSTDEEFRETQMNLEALEKEHKRFVHQLGELKEREFTLISREGRSEGIGEESVGEGVGDGKQAVAF